jgi:hypothetical protein
MSEVIVRAAVWKRAASILDFFTVFFVGGYAIGRLTGSITDDGFNLTGWAALALFGLIVIYFYLGRQFAGGTIWDRIFRIRRPQPI